MVRIPLSAVLLVTPPLSPIFYIVYLLCGLSDVLDGWIARRTHTVSVFGAKLDTLADLIFAAVMLAIFYPVLYSTRFAIVWVLAIAAIRSASMLVAFGKYRTFASIHTYGNKITGLAIFLLPPLLPVIPAQVGIYAVCALASLSAAEELWIQIASKRLELDRAGLFSKRIR